jgi:hypothetical protein
MILIDRVWVHFPVIALNPQPNRFQRCETDVIQPDSVNCKTLSFHMPHRFYRVTQSITDGLWPNPQTSKCPEPEPSQSPTAYTVAIVPVGAPWPGNPCIEYIEPQKSIHVRLPLRSWRAKASAVAPFFILPPFICNACGYARRHFSASEFIQPAPVLAIAMACHLNAAICVN